MSVFPFDGRRGPIIVSASASGPVESREFRLVLDTGATMTTLEARLLMFLGYDPDASTEVIEVTTTDSMSVRRVVRLNRLSALGKHRLGLPVVSQAFPKSAQIDGVLGLDFLRDCVLSIDFQNGQLTLS